MTTAHLRYGPEDLTVQLPDDLALRVMARHLPQGEGEPLALVARAVDAPTDALPLEEAARGIRSVAIVIPDGTRRASARVYLLPLISRLSRAGLRPDQMKLILARGIHAATARSVVREIIGPEMMGILKPVQSAPNTASLNVEIGHDPELGTIRVHRQVAEADLTILTGVVAPHHLAGFGGGAKALVPGVAERETVFAAHRLTLSSLVRPDGSIRSASGTLEDNPFHDALLRVAQDFGRTWLLNVVLGADEQIVGAAAGEVGAAHAAAVRLYRESGAMPPAEPHDMVLVGVGGARARDVIQGHKALLDALAFAKPGAPIVWALEAPNGPGHAALLPWFAAGKLPRHLAALRKDFHPYGLTAYSMRRIARDHPVYVFSEMSRDLLRPMGLLPCKSLQAAVDLALKENEVKSVAVLPG